MKAVVAVWSGNSQLVGMENFGQSSGAWQHPGFKTHTNTSDCFFELLMFMVSIILVIIVVVIVIIFVINIIVTIYIILMVVIFFILIVVTMSIYIMYLISISSSKIF